METIRLAVLGLNQGSKIARDAKKNPEIELVAVAGFGEHDEQVAKELEVPIFNDYQQLLKEVPLDAVAIALPNSLHVAATERALEAGIKNILLEKPIANTVEEGEHIIEICKEAGATLLIGHHRRSSNRYQLLRQVIESGKLGKIVGIQSNYAIAKPHEYFDVEWHTKKGGGPLLINAIHDFDDLNFVTGMKPAGRQLRPATPSAATRWRTPSPLWSSTRAASPPALRLRRHAPAPEPRPGARRTPFFHHVPRREQHARVRHRAPSASRTWTSTTRTTTPTAGLRPIKHEHF